MKNLLENSNNIVLKIGTAAITTEDNGINKSVIENIAKSCDYLIRDGKNIAIVTSGAIACGKSAIGNYDENTNPERLAAIGQPILMQAYREAFAKYGRHVGQILLTDENFDSRNSLRLLKQTYSELQKNEEIPIINENDAISTDEITFGDNDKLASKLTVDLNQDALIILTVYNGLLKNMQIVENAISYKKEYYDDLSKEIRRGGSGGLESKLESAKFCTKNNKICRIANINNDIIDILKGSVPSTTFYPQID
jgi:glutamate 5-kinase